MRSAEIIESVCSKGLAKSSLFGICCFKAFQRANILKDGLCLSHLATVRKLQHWHSSKLKHVSSGLVLCKLLLWHSAIIVLDACFIQSHPDHLSSCVHTEVIQLHFTHWGHSHSCFSSFCSAFGGNCCLLFASNLRLWWCATHFLVTWELIIL